MQDMSCGLGGHNIEHHRQIYIYIYINILSREEHILICVDIYRVMNKDGTQNNL